MIGVIVKAVLSPLLSLGGKYIDSTVDKAKLEAGVDRAAIEADVRFRVAAMEHPAFAWPLAILLGSHALYAASIPLDSITLMHGWFSPLELPKWYQDKFELVLLALTGLGAFIIKRRH